MSCEQKLRVQRLVVEDPAALDAHPWKAHLQECLECRHERYALERSLVVFRQFEADPAGFAGPNWESFSRALVRSQRRRLIGARLRAPLAAASLLAVVSTGVVLWPVAGPSDTAPREAQIVSLRPEQAQHLQRLLHESLDDAAAVGTRATHEGAAVRDASAARFAVGRVEPQASPPPVADSNAEATPAGDVLSPPAPAPEAVAERLPAPRRKYVSPFGTPPPPERRVARKDGERAPVLIFRSLQQRQARRPPIQVLPAVSPMPAESGLSLIRSLVSPHVTR